MQHWLEAESRAQSPLQKKIPGQSNQKLRRIRCQVPWPKPIFFNFFCKCDQISRKLRIWSRLLKKSLMEIFIFCAMFFTLFHDFFLRLLAKNVCQFILEISSPYLSLCTISGCIANICYAMSGKSSSGKHGTLVLLAIMATVW